MMPQGAFHKKPDRQSVLIKVCYAIVASLRKHAEEAQQTTDTFGRRLDELNVREVGQARISVPD